MNPYVVIDIGGTSIKYGLADAEGQLIETHEMPTEAQKGGPHILKTTKEIVARYLKKHALAGVAISSAGMVDPDKGEIFYAGPQIPNYAGTQFKKEIEEAFQLPCEIENDVNCARIGFYHQYPHYQNSALIYQPAIDYVDCGMIVQGKLYNGFSHFAGELRCLPFYDHLPNVAVKLPALAVEI